MLKTKTDDAEFDYVELLNVYYSVLRLDLTPWYITYTVFKWSKFSCQTINQNEEKENYVGGGECPIFLPWSSDTIIPRTPLNMGAPSGEICQLSTNITVS